jgi:hypothetical protein
LSARAAGDYAACAFPLRNPRPERQHRRDRTTSGDAPARPARRRVCCHRRLRTKREAHACRGVVFVHSELTADAGFNRDGIVSLDHACIDPQIHDQLKPMQITADDLALPGGQSNRHAGKLIVGTFAC